MTNGSDGVGSFEFYFPEMNYHNKEPNIKVELALQKATEERDKKNLYKAILVFNGALELEPKNPYALLERGTIYLILFNYINALDSFNKVEGFIKDYALIYNNRGSALMGLRRYEEALMQIQGTPYLTQKIWFELNRASSLNSPPLWKIG